MRSSTASLLGLAAFLLLSGCNISPARSIEPTQNPTLVKTGQAEAVVRPPKTSDPSPAPTKKLTLDTSGQIVAERIWKYSIKPGGRSLDISQAVEAVDKRSDQAIHHYTYSRARFGKLVGLPLPDQKTLYYPPNHSCEDQIKIQAIANDGLYAEFKVTIHVANQGGNPKELASADQPKDKVRPKLVITSPSNGATSDFVLIVRGTAVGLAGQSLQLIIRDREGVDYVQDDSFSIEAGCFEARGYLGELKGPGLGEEFKAWVKDQHGNVSNVVTVTRKRSGEER